MSVEILETVALSQEKAGATITAAKLRKAAAVIRAAELFINMKDEPGAAERYEALCNSVGQFNGETDG